MPEALPWWAQMLFIVFATTVAVTKQWYDGIQRKEMMNQFYGRHARPPEYVGEINTHNRYGFDN